jgi:hypothetical protein
MTIVTSSSSSSLPSRTNSNTNLALLKLQREEQKHQVFAILQILFYIDWLILQVPIKIF